MACLLYLCVCFRFLPGLLPGGNQNCPPAGFGPYNNGYPQPGYGGPINQYPSNGYVGPVNQPYNPINNGYNTNYPRNPGSGYAVPNTGYNNNGYNSNHGHNSNHGYNSGNNYAAAPSFVPSHNPPYPSGGYNVPSNGYNSYNNGYAAPASGYVSPYSSRSPDQGAIQNPTGSIPIIVGLPEGEQASFSEFAKSAKHADKSGVNFGN
jgi:hypothetical protein